MAAILSSVMLAGLVIGVLSNKSWAAPTASPSVRAAAKLKHRPPPTWIRHYLGDDRYKIAGGVWKVVSTQTDQLYHRPDCPLMLRRDPGSTIGFSSGQDAQDSGYAADPYCSPDLPMASYQIAAPVGSGKGGRSILLGDHASTVFLPAGWSHLTNKPSTYGAMSFTSDYLLAKPGIGVFISSFRGSELVGFMRDALTAPGRSKIAGTMDKSLAAFAGPSTLSAASQARIAAVRKQLKTTNSDSIKIGRWPASRMRIATKKKGEPVQFITTCTDTACYMIVDSVGGAKGSAVIHSFRPR